MKHFFYLIFFIVFICKPVSAVEIPAANSGIRIVSLKPNITQTLVALGLADRIVGITKFCQKPNNQAQIVADYTSIDVEAILRLKPDLVIASTENSQSRQYELLQAAKISVQILDFHNFQAMEQSLKKMGELFQVQKKSEELTALMESKLNDLRAKIIPASGLSPYFVVIVQRRPFMVAAGDTYISSLFTRAGLKNVYENNSVNYPVVDEESLLYEGPDYIFDLTHGPNAVSEDFLGRKTIPLPVENFLASPQSVDNLQKVYQMLENTKTVPVTSLLW